MLYKKFYDLEEYAAGGAFEEPKKSLFYRKALGIRRYYENCSLFDYENKPLYPSGAIKYDKVFSPHFKNGLLINFENISENDSELKRLVEAYGADFCRYETKVPLEHSVAGNMYCHSMPNYERIIKEGLNSYAERTKKIADADLRDGLLHIYEGIKCYIGRCVRYLEEVNADKELIRALKKVPLEKAENIYEAIVAWNFVM